MGKKKITPSPTTHRPVLGMTEAELDEKIRQLKEATQQANTALRDLRTMRAEIREEIKTRFGRDFQETFNRFAQETSLRNTEMVRELVDAYRTLQEGLVRRMAYIGLMTGADNKLVQIIALDVLKENGPVKLDEDGDAESIWHLVKEYYDEEQEATVFVTKHNMDAGKSRQIIDAVAKERDAILNPVALPKLFSANDTWTPVPENRVE